MGWKQGLTDKEKAALRKAKANSTTKVSQPAKSKEAKEEYEERDYTLDGKVISKKNENKKWFVEDGQIYAKDMDTLASGVYAVLAVIFLVICLSITVIGTKNRLSGISGGEETYENNYGFSNDQAGLEAMRSDNQRRAQELIDYFNR